MHSCFGPHFPDGKQRIRKLSQLPRCGLRKTESGAEHLEARYCLHEKGILIPAQLTSHGDERSQGDNFGQIMCTLNLSVFIHVSNIYYEPVSMVNNYYYDQDSVGDTHFFIRIQER